MQKTPNYNLNKPEQTDVVNIEDLNVNFDTLDEEVAKKVNATDIPTSLPANGGNAATVNNKTVLENVPAGAKFTDTVYTHPNDANTRHVTDSEKANWNGKANPNDVMNAVNAGSISQDPNTATNSYIMTNHANTPNKSIYWHILTFFYTNKSSNAAQIAVTYNGSAPMMYIRHKYETWTPWIKVYTDGVLPSNAVATEGTDYAVRRLRNIYAGTSDMTAGSSALASGAIYLVYE